jgi:hypothetical protein
MFGSKNNIIWELHGFSAKNCQYWETKNCGLKIKTCTESPLLTI